MSATILVTGGAGYVGSHCCKLLAATGFSPVVYDNLSTGHREFVRWGPLIEGDIRDSGRLRAVLAAHRPALVMHFAALSVVGESVRAPGRFWDVNVRGVLALLEAMRSVDCRSLVFSSTCAVYGAPGCLPVGEMAPKHPASPYGATKLAAELAMESHDAAHGLKSVRLRYFNACGADPDGEIGEDHVPETHLVPLVLDAASGRRASISIFGTDYPTADGTAIRDYVHVMDLASAHAAAARYLLDGGVAVALNLGTGQGHSVAEVISAARRVTGRPIATETAGRRAGDPAELVADPARAREVLGWQAERRALDGALADAWRWHRKRFGKRFGQR